MPTFQAENLFAAITALQVVGYLAAVLMFSTFYMKKMIPLRAVGIASNCTFIVFAGYSHVWPLFVLHCCLLPLNTIRMVQMIRLVSKVREAAKGDFNMDFLVPFMVKEHFKKGDKVFSKGDEADKIYYLQEGRVRLSEFGVSLKKGDIIGEIGIFSKDKKRTASLLCESDAIFLTIADKQILQLYFQNPKFGMYLVQMIIHRLVQNQSYVARRKPVEDVTINADLPVVPDLSDNV